MGIVPGGRWLAPWKTQVQWWRPASGRSILHQGQSLSLCGHGMEHELLSFIRSVYLKLSEGDSHRHKHRNVHARGRIEKAR